MTYIILGLTFSLAFISLLAVLFTDKKLIFSLISLGLFIYFYKKNIDLGNADLMTLVFFIAGILLLALELFVPGFGIFGVSGIALTIYSVFDAFDNNRASIFLLLFTATVIFITVTIFVNLGFSIKLFDKAILFENQSGEKGYNSKKDYTFLLNKKGYAKTILRPTGKIIIGDETYDAMTEGDFIKKASQVKVNKIKDGHIIVEEIKEDIWE